MSNKIKVTFSQPDENFENGNPYIHIANPNAAIDIRNQSNGNEIVIPMRKIKILFNYPLSKEVILEYQTLRSQGFTRSELARCICRGYQNIYSEEQDTINNSLNGSGSCEQYGIWGHNIDDLMLLGVEQKEGNLFALIVDS